MVERHYVQESLTVLPTLKREVRFTTFDVQFLNKSTATMLENTFKQFNNKHALFLRFNIHDKVNQFHVSIEQTVNINYARHYCQYVRIEIFANIHYNFRIFVHLKRKNRALYSFVVYNFFDTITYDIF